MLVKFKTATLEARVEMDAVPRVGDTISIMGELYEVGEVRWNIKVADIKQTVTTSLRPLQGSAKE